MRFNDAVIGLVVAAFAVAVLLYAQTLPTPARRPVGPAFFPSLIAGLMLLGSVALIVRGLQTYFADKRWLQSEAWMAAPISWWRMISVPAAVLIYVAVSPLLGFMPTVAALTSGLARLYGQRLVPALLIGITTAIVVYYAFSRLLLVPLPVGPLETLLR